MRALSDLPQVPKCNFILQTVEAGVAGWGEGVKIVMDTLLGKCYPQSGTRS